MGRWVSLEVLLASLAWQFVALAVWVMIGLPTSPLDQAEGCAAVVAVGWLLGLAANWKGWKRG